MGATATLIDPVNGSEIDIKGINERNYIDVYFASPDSANDSNFDYLVISITDLEPEFRLSGPGIGSISLDSSQAPIMIENQLGLSNGITFRYFLTGQFASSGDVELTFLENSWSYQYKQNIENAVAYTPNEEGNTTKIEPGDRAPLVIDVPIANNNSNLTIDELNIGSASEMFVDDDSNTVGVQVGVVNKDETTN